MAKLITALLLVLSLCGGAWGATWHVDTVLGTDDVSHGTAAGSDAWLTVKYALTGSRMAKGDTLLVKGVADESGITAVLSGANGVTTISPEAGETNFTLNIPVGGSTILTTGTNNFTFNNVIFSNTNSVATRFLNVSASSDFICTGCTFDYNNVDYASGPIVIAGAAITSSLTIQKSVIKNLGGTNNRMVSNRSTGASVAVFNFYKNLVDNAALFEDTNHPAVVNLINNTIVNTVGDAIRFQAVSEFYGYNNIYYTSSGTEGVFLHAYETTTAYWLANPTKSDFTNNILYYVGTGSLNALVKGEGDLIPILRSNKFVDPLFANASSDYTLQATSYACGRGDNSKLPSGGDINGTAWVGSDVGAYANPSATKRYPTISRKAAFIGDSIMLGTGTGGLSSGQEIWNQYNLLTHIPIVTGATVAQGGLAVTGSHWMADNAYFVGNASIGFLAIGINNISTRTPANLTNVQLATEIASVLSRISEYGMTPVWLGVESKKGNPPDNADSTEINSLVNATCTSSGWRHGSILSYFMTDANWKTDYYVDLTSDLHPNAAGHLVMAKLARSLYPGYPGQTGMKFDFQLW